MIKPTVGRIVWFTPLPTHPEHDKAPLAAIIAHVHHDRLVNLAVFDSDGNALFGRLGGVQNVPLVQPEDVMRPAGGYCEWMPYQTRKASGSESGEKAAGEQSI